ncbi:MAG: tetratricopeptide repeat protein [Sphingobacteriales bacterium]|nr:MAG: tetratricopeptide repeat protein [Sphingobacteriales bacterium]
MPEALKYLNEANKLIHEGVEFSKTGHSKLKTKIDIYNLLATAYEYVGDIKKSIQFHMEEVAIAEKSEIKSSVSLAYNNLSSSHKNQGNIEEALKYQIKSLDAALSQDDPYFIGIAYGNLGSIFIELQKIDSALYYNELCISYLLKIKDNKEGQYGALGWVSNIQGNIYLKESKLDSAYRFYHRSRKYREEINHNLGKFLIYRDIANLHHQWKSNDSAFYYINQSIALGRENGFLRDLDHSYLLRSEMLQHKGRFKEALSDYVTSIQIRDSVINEENGKNLLRQSLQYEHNLQQLADSLQYAGKEQVLKERTQKQRLGLYATVLGLFLVIALAYSIYHGKKISDQLLLNILPEETAKELKQKGSSEAKLIDQVTVLFTDFKGFTQISEKLSPQELVTEIDTCFRAFDNIVQKYGVEKIKTIGDSYMCAGGLPVPNATHAVDVIQAALDMQQFMIKHKNERETVGKLFFEIRIGVHTGPVVAGIVGIKKYSYDIWGDTVNTASRMESSSEAGKVNISGTTYELVKNKFKFEYRGKIEAKHKGEIDMYFVETI